METEISNPGTAKKKLTLLYISLCVLVLGLAIAYIVVKIRGSIEVRTGVVTKNNITECKNENIEFSSEKSDHHWQLSEEAKKNSYPYTKTSCLLETLKSGDKYSVNIGNNVVAFFTYKGEEISSDDLHKTHDLNETMGSDVWEYYTNVNPDKITAINFNIVQQQAGDISGFYFRDLNLDGYLDLLSSNICIPDECFQDVYMFDSKTSTFNDGMTTTDMTVKPYVVHTSPYKSIFSGRGFYDWTNNSDFFDIVDIKNKSFMRYSADKYTNDRSVEIYTLDTDFKWVIKESHNASGKYNKDRVDRASEWYTGSSIDTNIVKKGETITCIYTEGKIVAGKFTKNTTQIKHTMVDEDDRCSYYDTNFYLAHP